MFLEKILINLNQFLPEVFFLNEALNVTIVRKVYYLKKREPLCLEPYKFFSAQVKS